jgi:flagellar basal-body rod modification protein FlgD
MAVSSVSTLTSALTGDTGATGTTALGEDAFLTLLTTQMQYQDPLDPMSNEEFVAQLAQFSSLEELQGISAGLESLYLVNVSMNNASMASLMGQSVVANSESFHYGGDGDYTVHYDATEALSDATLTIKDADGNVVWSGDLGSVDAGEGSYTWDGKDQDGQVVAEGEYTATVTGTNASGEESTATGLLYGTVTGMDYSSGSPEPSIDGVTVAIGDIVRLGAEEGG